MMPYPVMHPVYAAYAAQAAHANLPRMQADGQPQNAAVPMTTSSMTVMNRLLYMGLTPDFCANRRLAH